MSKNTLIILSILGILLVAFLAWLFIESSKPLPGQKMADLGRGHIPIGENVDYNSNPPTSGPHYGDWVRAGVYESQRDDRNLVHSLEHGYVVMSYKCGQGSQGDQGEATESGQIDQECESRKKQLEEIYNKKGKRKLVVVPRENLDTNFALTAWTYIDKFDPSTSSGLSVSEIEKIEKFIDAHRDQGPERTME